MREFRNSNSRKGWGRVSRFTPLIVLIVLAAGLEAWRRHGPATGSFEGRARAIDGDSLRVAGREIRLRGIDAPEGRQTCERNDADWPCGDVSRKKLMQLTASASTTCHGFGQDEHGRWLAECMSGGRNVNAEMVEAGLAVSYGAYVREEAAAKAAKRGLWAGRFEYPRDWRRTNAGRE